MRVLAGVQLQEVRLFRGIARAMVEQWGKCVDNFDIK